jgi:CRISPR-associated protein Csx17
MAEHLLAGCRVEPLGSYLKALGVLRLVAEQADPAAAGWWSGSEFWLRTKLDESELVDFFVESYSPTPLLAPWNGGGGFSTSETRPTAGKAVQDILDSTSDRLAPFRDAIRVVRRLVTTPAWPVIEKSKPDAAAKARQIAMCRNEFPDSALGWLDASVLLANDRVVFPALLGSGGNDGSLDFSSNFMLRLADLLGLSSRPRGAASPADLARAALFATASVRLDRSAIGQFHPAGAGGPGSSPMGSAESLSNPWDFVLLLEGAIVFSSAAARRLSGQRSAAVPFMVNSSGSGYPSSAEAESSRGELWAPLWNSPTRHVEIERLMAEGRADFNGKQATTGVDVARSLATLGVDRGINSFARHGFMVRNGLATFAVPLGRVDVKPQKGAAVLGGIDRWVGQMRVLKNPPDSLSPLLRRLDNAQFAVARGGGAEALQDVLVTVAAIDGLAGRSREIREKAPRPLAGLAANDWLTLLDDGSMEFELAVALASLRTKRSGRSLVRALTSTSPEGPDRQPIVPGFGRQPVVAVLAGCLARLAIGRPIADHDLQPFSTHWLNGARPVAARLASVEKFVRGETDDERLTLLLAACGLLDWSGETEKLDRDYFERESPTQPAFALLAPFFHPRKDNPGALVADVSWPRKLIAGGVESVVADAFRKLHIAGFETVLASPGKVARDVDGLRLAAACLIPISSGAAVALTARCTVTKSQPETSPTNAETTP